jgi:hypothetical protein
MSQDLADKRAHYRRLAADAMFNADGMSRFPGASVTHRSDVEEWITTGCGTIYAALPGLTDGQWRQLERVARALFKAGEGGPVPVDDAALVQAFSEALDALCARFGVTFEHEDSQGSGYLKRAPEGEACCGIFISDRVRS